MLKEFRDKKNKPPKSDDDGAPKPGGDEPEGLSSELTDAIDGVNKKLDDTDAAETPPDKTAPDGTETDTTAPDSYKPWVDVGYSEDAAMTITSVIDQIPELQDLTPEEAAKKADGSYELTMEILEAVAREQTVTDVAAPTAPDLGPMLEGLGGPPPPPA